MGTFEVQLEIAGPSREGWRPLEALVDTGSTYTVLPAALLDELGVEREHVARFELADGREVEHDLGYVWVRHDGAERQTQVVFGDHALLGAVTLEQFLLM